MLQPRYIAATLFLPYTNPENGGEAITFVWHDLSLKIQTIYWSWFPCCSR